MRNIRISDARSNGLRLTWDPPSVAAEMNAATLSNQIPMTTNNIPTTSFTAEQDAKVDYYVVKYFVATNPLQPVELQVKVPTIEISDLLSNSKYEFQVNFLCFFEYFSRNL